MAVAFSTVVVAFSPAAVAFSTVVVAFSTAVVLFSPVVVAFSTVTVAFSPVAVAFSTVLPTFSSIGEKLTILLIPGVKTRSGAEDYLTALREWSTLMGKDGHIFWYLVIN